MSAIASKLRSHWLEIAWGVFSLINLVLIPVFGAWETIPFHFVWVSLTLLYGLHVWRLGTTAAVVTVICAATTAALWLAFSWGQGEISELTEVPLMAAMFLAMVWHARRRQAAMEDVRKAAEREREFVRDASHQLRTPISIAKAHAELLRDSTEAHSTADAVVILDELARLATITDRMLLLAGSGSPGFLRRERVDLGAFVATIGRRWRASAQRTWRVASSAEGWILADPERLGVALDALLENAVKFTDTGGTISVLGHADGSYAVIEVTDDGPGIPVGEAERIFDRFAQALPAKTGAARGTGLGLAIVKAIVESHGGSIQASNRIGGGAVFSIRLPGLEPVDSEEWTWPPDGSEAEAGTQLPVPASAAPSVDL